MPASVAPRRGGSFASDARPGAVHAFRDVSFNAPRGKIIGIVGGSGSGKSAVISAMTRLLAGNGVVGGGDILFDGREVRRHFPLSD